MDLVLHLVKIFVGLRLYKSSSNRPIINHLSGDARTGDFRKFTQVFQIAILSLFFIATLMGSLNASASVESEKATSKAQISSTLKGKSLIITASRKEASEAILFGQELQTKIDRLNINTEATVFLADNGWYAISIGDTAINQCRNTVLQLVQAKIVPSDTFCSKPEKFVAVFSITNSKLLPLIGRDFNQSVDNQAANVAVDQSDSQQVKSLRSEIKKLQNKLALREGTISDLRVEIKKLKEAAISDRVSKHSLKNLQNKLTLRERTIADLKVEIEKLREAAMLGSSSKQSLSTQQPKTAWPESLDEELEERDYYVNESNDFVRNVLASTNWSVVTQERCFSDAESYLRLDDKGYTVFLNGEPSGRIPSVEFKTRSEDTRLSENEFYAVYKKFIPGRKWPTYPDIELEVSGVILPNGKLKLNTQRKIKDILSGQLRYFDKQKSDILPACISEPKSEPSIKDNQAINIILLTDDISKNSLSLSDCEASLKTISKNSKKPLISTYRKKSEDKLILEIIPGEKGCTKGLRDIGVCKKFSEVIDYSISNGVVYMSLKDDQNCTIKSTVPNVPGIQQGNTTTTSQCKLGPTNTKQSYLVCSPIGQPQKKLAKKDSLNQPVKIVADAQTTAKQRCEADLSGCSMIDLCETATYTHLNTKKWRRGHYTIFVDEAKRRSLICDVDEEKRKVEQKQKAEEKRKKAEEKRKKAEEKRKADRKRKAEEKRIADQNQRINRLVSDPWSFQRGEVTEGEWMKYIAKRCTYDGGSVDCKDKDRVLINMANIWRKTQNSPSQVVRHVAGYCLDSIKLVQNLHYWDAGVASAQIEVCNTASYYMFFKP